MGKRNRQNRAAKQKHRQRSAAAGRTSQPDAGQPSRAQVLEHLVFAISSAASAPSPWRAADLLEKYRGYERELDIAADLVVHEAIGTAWEHGWSPTDLHEVARRRIDAAGVRYLDEAIMREAARYSSAALHPRWRAELAGIAATIGPSAATAPQMWHWAASQSIDEGAVMTLVLNVVHLLGRIPGIPALLPLPGTYRNVRPVVAEADEKMLARVRALLAKAEATDFPEEAEALSAKAQALMVQYSLREAVTDYDRGRQPVAAPRRLWIDNPYVAAKVALVQAVADANRSRTVWVKGLGCVVIVGSDTDCDLVELLVTSLLVQANRAMLLAGRRHEIAGQTRTKSFRHSFLVAYANRIGERLSGASSSAIAELERDDRLLPVLAARNRAADEAFARICPEPTASPLFANDSVGVDAGRAAADTAMLDVRRPIAG